MVFSRALAARPCSRSHSSSPRWTAHDAKYFGAELPKKAEAVVQERAYTSPIWYAP